MENTYNSLKTVFQNLKKENSKNPSFLFLILVLWCIPLSYAFNSIALGLLTAVTLFAFKKSNFKIDATLLLPIGLFLLMGISLLWTNDLSASTRALLKGLPLLLIPLTFCMFPRLSKEQKQKIISFYAYGIVVFTVFYLIKASIRFLLYHDSSVFFYHELVTEDVNAIHVSVYVALSVFYFITKTSKSNLDKIAIVVLSLFLILLSSKNIIVIFLVLIVCYYWRHYQSNNKNRIIKIGAFLFLILVIAFSGKIKNRFLIEYESNVTENTVNEDIGTAAEKVYNVSVKKAWTQDQFQKNDFFPGTAFRVYQIRIFKEMVLEDSIWLTGYGLNATDFKIAEKGKQHNVYEGYWLKNFHNEYLQIFAEIGIFGLLLIMTMLFINIKNALKAKDFIHISFAVLMISLFLTESFLCRQRGIVFFAIMYCLLNAKTEEAYPQNKNLL